MDVHFLFFKVWMLTGDKLETATSIAVSSRLVSRAQPLFSFKQVHFLMAPLHEYCNGIVYVFVCVYCVWCVCGVFVGDDTL